jgi:aromatic ring-cleaving dioxygenase
LKGNYRKNIKTWVKEHKKATKVAIHDNGDQIKYDKKNEIEWIFSPRIGWNEMREK